MKCICIALCITLGTSLFADHPDEKSWSKPVNGVRAQIMIKEAKVMNNTVIMATYLTLQNVSDIGNPMKIEWDNAKIVFRVVDESGKEIPKVTEMLYDGGSCGTGILVLPYDSSLTFKISQNGLGIPKGKAALLDFGSRNCWTIDKTDGKSYFLQITFTIKDSGKPINQRYWHGTIEIPKARIPLKK